MEGQKKGRFNLELQFIKSLSWNNMSWNNVG